MSLSGQLSATAKTPPPPPVAQQQQQPQPEVVHSVAHAATAKVTAREKVSAIRQTRESPPPQKKRQAVVDSELRKR